MLKGISCYRSSQVDAHEGMIHPLRESAMDRKSGVLVYGTNLGGVLTVVCTVQKKA